MTRRLRRLATALAVATPAALAAQTARPAADTPGTTAEVFRRYAAHTLRIQVVEAGSAAKASLGTGFFVDGDGHVMTNYHVVSKLVTEPARYRAEFTDPAGTTRPLTVIAIDVVGDLAVLATPYRSPAYFTLASPPGLTQGARLFSLGHPRDLGLSIVEGTYNGHLQHTLYPKIHFTGAINPGMSGGPALAASGEVVGVNVATAGDEVSFLVPAERAIALLERTRRSGFVPSPKPLADVAAQLRAYQDEYLADMFGASTPKVVIGDFTLPTTPAPFFRCWADAEREKEAPYEAVEHSCSTDDYVFISGDQSSGVVEVKHRVLTSASLTPSQFAALYTKELAAGEYALYGSEEEVTRFECETHNVRTAAGREFRAQLCVRRYRRLDGLYDAVLRAAALGPRRAGLVTTLTLSGVSFDNVRRLALRYLESISWRA